MGIARYFPAMPHRAISIALRSHMIASVLKKMKIGYDRIRIR